MSIQYVQNLGKNLEIYFCGQEACDPGHSFGPAVRSHYLFHFVLRGQGFYQTGGIRYPLKAGQGFLILPGETTYYEADETDPWEYVWIGLGGTEASALLEQCGMGAGRLIFTDQSGGLLARELQKLVELFVKDSGNELELLGQCYFCLAKMARRQGNQKNSDRSYAEQAAEFIQNNFSYDIKVSDLANHVGLDRSYFYKVFHQRYGMSPQEYLIGFRLQTAAELLKRTDLNMTEIAFSSGFRELSAFYRGFKNRYGVTPRQYRLSCLKKEK